MSKFLNVAKNLEVKEISENVEFYCENRDNKNDTETKSELSNTVNDKNEHTLNTSLFQKNTEGIFVCLHCQSQFTLKASLKTHIQSIHEGQRHPCHYCNHQATTSGNLKAHIQSKHEGVKHDCNYCNYQATQQSHLTRHIQRKHSGVKPYNHL